VARDRSQSKRSTLNVQCQRFKQKETKGTRLRNFVYFQQTLMAQPTTAYTSFCNSNSHLFAST